MQPREAVSGLARLFGRPAPLVGQTPADVVHEENKWRLLRYVPRPDGIAFRTPVLLIPSLINRHYVLDLMPGKSFAQSLVAAGHDVYVIDWGTPEAEDRFVSFEDIVVGDGAALGGKLLAQVVEESQADVPGETAGGGQGIAEKGQTGSHVGTQHVLHGAKGAVNAIQDPGRIIQDTQDGDDRLRPGCRGHRDYRVGRRRVSP